MNAVIEEPKVLTMDDLRKAEDQAQAARNEAEKVTTEPEPFSKPPMVDGRMRIGAFPEKNLVEIYFTSLDQAIHISPEDATRVANMLHKAGALVRKKRRK